VEFNVADGGAGIDPSIKDESVDALLPVGKLELTAKK
jgi:hypothetical protein